MPPSVISRCAVLAASSFAVLVNVAVGAPDTQETTDVSKNHILFVGTDLAVKQEGDFRRVVNANKDALQIERGGKVVDLRSPEGLEVKVLRGVKLSSLSAMISNVRTDSVDRAAARAQFDAMRAAIILDDQAANQVDAARGRMLLTSYSTHNLDNLSGPGSAAAIVAGREAAMDSYTSAMGAANMTNIASSTFMFEKMGKAGTAEVEMSFDVSSPEPLENAYLVVVANYGADDKVAHQISARELKQVDSRPRKVSVSQPGSVAGLPFKKFDVALFANGQEVATNMSERRLPLSKDEAYQFVLLNYLTSHPGETKPPTPVLMLPRTEFRRQVGSVEANQPIYAKVDKSGSVVALSSDADGATKLPASVEGALQGVRFMPALKDGAPAEGTVKLTLAQLLY